MMFKRFKLMEEGDGDGGDTGSGSGPSGGDAIGTGNDARIALLNSIGDQYDNIRSEDLADINDDGTTSPFTPPTMDEDPAEAAARAEQEQAERDRLAAEEAAAKSDPVVPTTQMITRKVNGKDVTLPLEEWLIRAQKVESADEYLIDAARQRKEVQREQPPVPAVTQGPSTEEIAAQQLAERRELARAIQMGTEEEAVAAIGKLQNMSKSPALTVADVSRVADERLKFNTALNWFADTYKDLTGNPQLYNMVVEREAALVRAGDTRPYAERYKEVGEEVRKWRDDLIGSVVPPTPGVPPVASLDAKRAAKAAAPKPPAAAGAKAAQVPQDEEDESASSVIAAMAKARGGPQWARG